MKDPNAGKYKRSFGKEFRMALEVLEELGSYQGVLKWSDHDYQAFTYTERNVKLVFYPHKTTAGNIHIRVRDEGSKDEKRAEMLMDALDRSSNTCTFSYNRKVWNRPKGKATRW